MEKLFTRIYKQAEGMLWKQGGPVIGIQIENEYGHCGGLTGEAGRKHMMTLKQMAVDIGFETPYYTATGWGGGIVPDGEMLPVLGAYCDAPWEQHLNPMPLNANYIFSYCKDDGNIGTDLQVAREQEFTYDVEKYPFFTAELGGGMQATSHRRPIADKKDTCAIALCKLGSGANLLGYYMYHGGTNPTGKDSTLQESRETGYLNDLPVFSYDFQAPVGEYGRIHEVFYHLRPLHLFLEEFGEKMARTETVLPQWNAECPENLESLRMAVRHNYADNSGFLFVNAYQRHARVREYQGVQIQIETEQGCVRFPKVDIRDGNYGVYPYGMKVGDGYLESSNAQLLCRPVEYGSSSVRMCGWKR